jgi:osmotically-inducible protein OsmY
MPLRQFRNAPAAAGILLAACLAQPLAGCVGAAVGGAAAVTTAAMEERGLKGAAKDTAVRAAILDKWIDKSEEMTRKVDITITEGRVLLTGIVPSQQMRLDAVRLAWQANGVKEVINEIQVNANAGIGTYARDTWITTQLVGKLTVDKHVLSINYSVETVDGIVYLMGIAQNQAELDRVQNHARNLSYVRKVVSYVRLKDDPRRGKT